MFERMGSIKINPLLCGRWVVRSMDITLDQFPFSSYNNFVVWLIFVSSIMSGYITVMEVMLISPPPLTLLKISGVNMQVILA
jgi:hypothetical protein